MEHDRQYSTNKKFIYMLKNLVYSINYFFGGREWSDNKLKPLQKKLLEAFLPTLEPAFRVLIERQLSQPFKVSFWHHGKVSPFFFENPKLEPQLLIPDREFFERLYKVEMFVDGRKQYAHVIFYKGRIFSLEFKQPLKFYEGKDIRFGAAKVGTPKQSLSAAIDRREHGKDGHYATGEGDN